MKYLPIILLALLLCLIPAFGQAEAVNDFIKKSSEFAAQNEYEKAIAELGQAIAIDPKQSFLFLTRAGYYAKLKDFDASLKDLKTAIAVDPEFPSVLNMAGRQFNLNGQYEEGVNAADSLIVLEPQNPTGYELRAESKYALNNYPGAFEDSLKVIELTPLDRRLNTTRLSGLLTNELKKDGNIFFDYERLLDRLDHRYEQLGKLPDMYPRFADAPEVRLKSNGNQTEMFPQILFLLSNAAALYDEKGKPDQAFEMLKRIAHYEPLWKTLVIRAKYYLNRKSYATAIEDLTGAIELRKQVPNLQSEAFVLRGDVYVLTNQPENALADYETAKALDKNIAYLVNYKVSRIKEKLAAKTVQLK
jgi:tetratricopeptide (TPR) repeat protein